MSAEKKDAAPPAAETAAAPAPAAAPAKDTDLTPDGKKLLASVEKLVEVATTPVLMNLPNKAAGRVLAHLRRCRDILKNPLTK